MEKGQPMVYSAVAAPKEARLWRFVLERAVHDLNNNVGGVLSLVEAHLSRKIDDPELRQSLELIGESVCEGRDLLAGITDLLAAVDSSSEPMPLRELLAYTHDRLRLFLPRRLALSVRPSEGDAVVKVDAKGLLIRLLLLMENDLANDERTSWAGELMFKVESTVGWLIYRSTNRTGAGQSALCQDLFSSLHPPLARFSCREQSGEFEVAMGFEVVG